MRIARALGRLGSCLAALVSAATLTFLLLRAVPGDPATALAGEHADAEAIRNVRERWGLDQPLWKQYLRFLRNLARGDLGESIATGRPVVAEILDRFPATLELAACAVCIALLVGVPLGLAAGLRAGGPLDSLVGALSMVGVSVPIFVTGYVLILAKVFGGIPFLEFAGRRDEFRPLEYETHFYVLESLLRLDPARLADTLTHLALPAVTLATVPLATFARMTRAGIAETLAEPFVLTARAKGLSRRRIWLAHLLPSVAVTLWTTVGLQAGYLLGGAVLTETVFAWPGLGGLFYQAVGSRDYALLSGAVLFSSGVFLAMNAMVDLLYPWIDPRLT